MFEMLPTAFRTAVYKDLTRVHEYILLGRRKIVASCPKCMRMVLDHPLDARPEDNARKILEVHEHLRTCAFRP